MGFDVTHAHTDWSARGNSASATTGILPPAQCHHCDDDGTWLVKPVISFDAQWSGTTGVLEWTQSALRLGFSVALSEGYGLDSGVSYSESL